MRKIDLYSWDRREIYDFFSPLAQPWYTVSFRLDVGGLYRYAKANGLSFYYAMCYLVTQAVNGTEAFLYTIRGGEVLLLDRREPSFTVRRADEKYFRIVTMPCRDSLAEFCREAAEREGAQDAFIDPKSESDALLYLSCLPWVDLTALTNERGDDRDDAIPRIAWGKFVEEGGRLMLGMSVEVNHRFVDGADIGAFVGRLEKKLAELS
jgi:chloramphenicol O-acetyltransferase type A